MRVDQLRCLVTGATGGIGQALCRELVAGGAKLLLAGRCERSLQKLAGELPEASVLSYVAGDLANTDALNELAQVASEHQLNALVNLMGANQLVLADQQSDELISQLIDINLKIPLLLTKKLLPALLSCAEATILNVGSTFGSIGFPAYTTYCAAKFGLRGYSQSLRRELSDTSVSIVYFAPRATATAMNSDRVNELNKALGNRTDSVDTVAKEIAVSLCRSKPSRFIGWPEKLFVGINQLFPKLVDRSLAGQLPTIRKYADQQSESLS